MTIATVEADGGSGPEGCIRCSVTPSRSSSGAEHDSGEPECPSPKARELNSPNACLSVLPILIIPAEVAGNSIFGPCRNGW